jgi:hypothetical protein
MQLHYSTWWEGQVDQPIIALGHPCVVVSMAIGREANVAVAEPESTMSRLLRRPVVGLTRMRGRLTGREVVNTVPTGEQLDDESSRAWFCIRRQRAAGPPSHGRIGLSGSMNRMMSDSGYRMKQPALSLRPGYFWMMYCSCTLPISGTRDKIPVTYSLPRRIWVRVH